MGQGSFFISCTEVRMMRREKEIRVEARLDRGAAGRVAELWLKKIEQTGGKAACAAVLEKLRSETETR